MRIKPSPIRSYASQTLESIRDECAKNQQGEQIHTSYKPLLFQSSDRRRRKYSFQTSKAATRYKTQSLNNTFVNLIASKTLQRTPTFQNPIQTFLKKLYLEKMKDLKVIINKKQEQMFVDRLSKTIDKETFEASQCDFGLHSVNLICKYLKNSLIQRLTLDKNPIGDEGVKKLSKILKTMPLSHLSLVSINISSKGGKQLLKSIVGAQYLVSIDFSSPEGFNRNRFNPEGIQHIKEVLTHENCQLKHINLANVSMGEKGFIFFCEGLNKQNIHLEELNLSMNDIKLDKDYYKLYSDKLSFLKLKTLDLSQNKLGDLCLQIFAQILGNQKYPISLCLKELNLSKNGIQSYNCELFATQLAKNKSLTHLALNNNPLTEGNKFYHFKFLLQHGYTLTHLELRNSLAWQSNLKIVSDGMEKNNSLISLDLSQNSFSEESFIYLLSHLKENEKLKCLKMENCSIIDSYIVKGEPSLSANPTIQSLDISNNFIKDRGARILLKLLMKNSKIYQMNLKKNCISFGILNEIAHMLKQNEISNTYPEPTLYKFSIIEERQNKQKSKINQSIAKLKQKMDEIKVVQLVNQIVEKQTLIVDQAKTFKNQEQKLADVRLQYEKRKKMGTFLVTS